MKVNGGRATHSISDSDLFSEDEEIHPKLSSVPGTNATSESSEEDEVERTGSKVSNSGLAQSGDANLPTSSQKMGSVSNVKHEELLDPKRYKLDHTEGVLFSEDLSEEDQEIWIMQCPLTIPQDALLNQQLVLNSTSHFVSNSPAHENVSFKAKMTSVVPKHTACILPSRKSGAFTTVVLHPTRLVMITEEMEIPEVANCLQRSCRVSDPDKLKLRHPLFGSDFEKILKSNRHSWPQDLRSQNSSAEKSKKRKRTAILSGHLLEEHNTKKETMNINEPSVAVESSNSLSEHTMLLEQFLKQHERKSKKRRNKHTDSVECNKPCSVPEQGELRYKSPQHRETKSKKLGDSIESKESIIISKDILDQSSKKHSRKKSKRKKYESLNERNVPSVVPEEIVLKNQLVGHIRKKKRKHKNSDPVESSRPVTATEKAVVPDQMVEEHSGKKKKERKHKDGNPLEKSESVIAVEKALFSNHLIEKWSEEKKRKHKDNDDPVKSSESFSVSEDVILPDHLIEKHSRRKKERKPKLSNPIDSIMTAITSEKYLLPEDLTEEYRRKKKRIHKHSDPFESRQLVIAPEEPVLPDKFVEDYSGTEKKRRKDKHSNPVENSDLANASVDHVFLGQLTEEQSRKKKRKHKHSDPVETGESVIASQEIAFTDQSVEEYSGKKKKRKSKHSYATESTESGITLERSAFADQWIEERGEKKGRKHKLSNPVDSNESVIASQKSVFSDQFVEEWSGEKKKKDRKHKNSSLVDSNKSLLISEEALLPEQSEEHSMRNKKGKESCIAPEETVLSSQLQETYSDKKLKKRKHKYSGLLESSKSFNFDQEAMSPREHSGEHKNNNSSGSTVLFNTPKNKDIHKKKREKKSSGDVYELNTETDKKKVKRKSKKKSRESETSNMEDCLHNLFLTQH